MRSSAVYLMFRLRKMRYTSAVRFVCHERIIFPSRLTLSNVKGLRHNAMNIACGLINCDMENKIMPLKNKNKNLIRKMFPLERMALCDACREVFVEVHIWMLRTRRDPKKIQSLNISVHMWDNAEGVVQWKVPSHCLKIKAWCILVYYVPEAKVSFAGFIFYLIFFFTLFYMNVCVDCL